MLYKISNGSIALDDNEYHNPISDSLDTVILYHFKYHLNGNFTFNSPLSRKQYPNGIMQLYLSQLLVTRPLMQSRMAWMPSTMYGPCMATDLGCHFGYSDEGFQCSTLFTYFF